MNDLAGIDQRHRAPEVLPAVHGDHRLDVPRRQEEGKDIPSLQAATHDELIERVMRTGILQVDVVLVGPEPGHRAVRFALAEHAASRGCALLHRVLPVFDSHPLADCRVIVIGDVPGCVDNRDPHASRALRCRTSSIGRSSESFDLKW